MRDGAGLGQDGGSGNTGLGTIGKYVGIKASGVDKVVQGESIEWEGNRGSDSSEQHPLLRGGQEKREGTKEPERIGWKENTVSLKPREDSFKE